MLQLAKSENIGRILVECDARSYFDAIKDGWIHAAWPIQTLTSVMFKTSTKLLVVVFLIGLGVS